jgi:hypothetical protein
MYFARARMYAPGLGRFVNRDPLGYVDGMGLYAGYFVPGGLDPSGRYVYIKTWRPGILGAMYDEHKFTSLPALVKFLKETPDGSIARFEVHGHSQNAFGYVPDTPEGELLESPQPIHGETPVPRGGYNVKGNQWIFSNNVGSIKKPNHMSVDILPLLNRKYVKNAIFYLGGCQTDQTAKELSGLIGGASVAGNVGVANAYPEWLTGELNSISSVEGGVNYYREGNFVENKKDLTAWLADKISSN